MAGFIICTIIFRKITSINLLENQNLESLWILIPLLILLKIGIPSLYLLYITDDLVNRSVTLKVNAHQGYWRYEYSDFWSEKIDSSIEFDSYIVPDNELSLGIARLLDTDLRPVPPYLIQTRGLITWTDILHSWALPRLGVKAEEFELVNIPGADYIMYPEALLVSINNLAVSDFVKFQHLLYYILDPWRDVFFQDPNFTHHLPQLCDA